MIVAGAAEYPDLVGLFETEVSHGGAVSTLSFEDRKAE